LNGIKAEMSDVNITRSGRLSAPPRRVDIYCVGSLVSKKLGRPSAGRIRG